MSWIVKYLPEAEKDLKELDGSQRVLILKAIKKVVNQKIENFKKLQISWKKKKR